MRILNATIVKPRDLRMGKFSKHARAVSTPYGMFRSVAVARDVIMTEHPGFWMDLVGSFLTPEDIAKRVYYRVYQRCQRGDAGWNFEDERQ